MRMDHLAEAEMNLGGVKFRVIGRFRDKKSKGFTV